MRQKSQRYNNSNFLQTLGVRQMAHNNMMLCKTNLTKENFLTL